MCTVAIGNITDGISLWGIFDSPDDAVLWAEKNLKVEWQILLINAGC